MSGLDLLELEEDQRAAPRRLNFFAGIDRRRSGILKQLLSANQRIFLGLFLAGSDPTSQNKLDLKDL